MNKRTYDEDGDLVEEDNKEEETETIGKSVNISALNICVELKSEDKGDTLEKMIKSAREIIDKYK